MKTAIITVLFTLFSLFACGDPVNAVLGDESFRFYFGKYPDAQTSESLRISTHLRYVELLLLNAPVEHLSADKIRSRMRMLDLLHRYRLRGEFPSNYDHPGERRPCFIDKKNNICAVGYLIEQTAGRALANQINARHQYDLIENMNMPELNAWVEESGLTLQECAMIQPSYVDSNDGRVVIPESKLTREEIAEHLTKHINLPDSFFNAGPMILNVNFMITKAGTTALVKFDRVLPQEAHQRLVKAVKKLRFKPAYRYRYIREENRYITENIVSREKMMLVITKAGDSRTVIGKRSDILIPRDEDNYFERYVRNVLEIFPQDESPDSETIKLNGVLTDQPSLNRMKLYGGTSDGLYTLIRKDIPLENGKFELTFENENYASLKAAFFYNGNHYYSLTDIKPVDQTMLITFEDIEDIHEICGGGCFEVAQDTKKAWYQPILIEQQTLSQEISTQKLSQ
jgi:hypothetical protein